MPRDNNLKALITTTSLLCAALLMLLLLVSPLPVAAQQEEPIVITAQADKQEMRIGDTLTCTITVEWQKGVEVKTVEPSEKLGTFEIQNVQELPAKKIGAGRFRKVFTYTLSTFDTGDFEIPSFRVNYTTSDGKEKQADSQPLHISVKGVVNTSDQQTDVRDIKPPLSIPADMRLLTILIIAVLAILLGGAVFWFYIRKRLLARRAAPGEWIPPKPIEELAYDDLNALEASDLLAQRRLKEYYTRLSEIIRVYLGRRFRFPALDMTSFETLHRLSDFINDTQILELIEGVFEECDLVKFAKHVPPDEISHAAVTRARRIVALTTPQPVTEEHEAAPAQVTDAAPTTVSAESKEKNADQ
jgi:hypothetical protein